MSSGGAGTKQEALENYEKDYLERLEKEKNSQNIQNFVFKMAEEAKTHVTKDYIGFCAFCTMGVGRDEMAYHNNLLFHSNCFEQQGKNFPAANKDLATKQASAKIELVQLKNLKIRMSGTGSPPRATPRPKTKAKRKKVTRRRNPTRRKPTRRKVTKRRKTKRITKRRKSRRTSRRRPARRSSRRRTRKKARRRTKRSSSRRRRR